MEDSHPRKSLYKKQLNWPPRTLRLDLPFTGKNLPFYGASQEALQACPEAVVKRAEAV
jgi:hypothetical protein